MTDPSVDAWREATGQSTSARLRLAEQAMARAERERDDLRRQLESAYGKDLEHVRKCAWRALAIAATREQPSGIYPARQDAGVCVLCGQPIVRGHWFEAVDTGTTKPNCAHAAGICPDPTPAKEN